MILNNSILLKYKTAIFIVLLLIIYWLFNYNEILFLHPQSYHFWRQTDCLSITLNYHKFNLPFLEPELHHFYGNGGKTVGEFPILYYLASQFYGLFNLTEFWLRLINLSIFTLGLIYLSKLIFNLTKDIIQSLFGPLLILSSTIIIFYANNFLPDVPSLGLTFIALYYFHKYHINNKTKSLIIASLVITLAGLIKITALISAASIGVILIYESIKERKINFKGFLILSIPFILNMIWIMYSKYYKEINENAYLMMRSKPIWNYSKEFVELAWQRLTTNQKWGWKRDILPPANIWLVLCSMPLFFIIKMNVRLRIFAISSLILSIIFILLMFPQFYHHDYYLIHVIAYFVLAFLVVLNTINYQKLYNYLTSILIVILSTTGILYSKERLNDRYENFDNTFDVFYNLKPKLNLIGVSKESKLISISDNTYCASLYILDRKGWTNLALEEEIYIIDKKNVSVKNITSKIDERINKDADFLIIKSDDEYQKYIPSNYKTNLIFEDKDFLIYKL